jgi:dinuclear metal center YbgI/SA1388 family protein
MSVRVHDIQHALDAWAPRSAAWERDNVGIQCGNPAMTVRGILICLDITEDVVRDALRRSSNLIVSHHPLLYRPLSSVTPATQTGRIVSALLQKHIAAIAVHTNLDAAPEGTSWALARVLGVPDPQVMDSSSRLLVKVVVFVPAAATDRVAHAMTDAGAGSIGNYQECTFRSNGIGTFRGNADSRPAVGRRGVLERVDEVRLEMLVRRDLLRAVTDAMCRAHPYEAVAYDIVPIENAHPLFGMGAIGDLPRPVTLTTFLRRIRKSLGTGTLRFSGDPHRKIARIAVCGGSGSKLLENSINRHADVFVTADIPFHTFQQAAGRIALVDAGHHETEYPVLATIAGKIREACRMRGERTPVAVSAVRTNPIAYV